MVQRTETPTISNCCGSGVKSGIEPHLISRRPRLAARRSGWTRFRLARGATGAQSLAPASGKIRQ
jgi:hypothetical protein